MRENTKEQRLQSPIMPSARYHNLHTISSGLQDHMQNLWSSLCWLHNAATSRPRKRTLPRWKNSCFLPSSSAIWTLQQGAQRIGTFAEVRASPAPIGPCETQDRRGARNRAPAACPKSQARARKSGSEDLNPSHPSKSVVHHNYIYRQISRWSTETTDDGVYTETFGFLHPLFFHYLPLLIILLYILSAVSTAIRALIVILLNFTSLIVIMRVRSNEVHNLCKKFINC